MQLAAAALVLLASACASEGSACRNSDQCGGSLECAGPNDPQVCGIPANEQCSSDADCDESSRCHAVDDPCSPDGVGSECRQPCTEGGCGEGFRCAASGACEVVPCDEGYDCPSYQTCDPSVPEQGPVHARAHGCVAIDCSDDAQCPAGGACVNAVCHEGPGSCVEPQLVP
ncbi:hypothetical protein [Enhygromyxa salina]|uniref:hypothetical protein n=1 Tax=Enhygromyxa salina TaxID=215803 RepID=UPI000D0903A5|nr:hypothetical protein [Enhygromyxa salina]